MSISQYLAKNEQASVSLLADIVPCLEWYDFCAPQLRFVEECKLLSTVF